MRFCAVPGCGVLVGKGRDANEAAIVEALRTIGARVWRISGREVPDLLVWYRGRPFVGEVKTGTGKKTVAQRDIPWPIWRSVGDALESVLEKRLTRGGL